MNSSKQPSLAELTSRAVARSNQIHSDELAGDVEPHEILATIRVDAQAAWTDSQLALQLLGLTVSLKTAPLDWATFVDSSTGRIGIPLSAGQFPQRLREVAGLFAANLVEPTKLKPIGMTGLKNWVGRTQTSKNLGETLLANGIGHEVGEVVSPISGNSPAEINEQAARLWIDGQREAALSVWQSLSDGPVASFNVGMALLMLNRAPMAISHLQAAVATLPADSGWQQLAALYLSVALIRD